MPFLRRTGSARDRIQRATVTIRCRCRKRLLDVDATWSGRPQFVTIESDAGYPDRIRCPRCDVTWPAGALRLWHLTVAAVLGGLRRIEIDAPVPTAPAAAPGDAAPDPGRGREADRGRAGRGASTWPS